MGGVAGPAGSVIPEVARAWFDAPDHATLATLMPDGTPQLSVVWIGRDGNDLLVSTIEGRRKYLNILRDPRVTVLQFPSDNPDAYVEVRGTASMTREGAVAFVDSLCHAYTGADRHAADDGTDNVRVIVRITPERVFLRNR